MDTFIGFAPPTENWSKLPHEMIDALPQVETVGEMKIILYILRHTWGYHDTEKRISLHEFEHGRRRKGGGRIDNGTGLTKNTIKDGIRRAIDHGFIVMEEDDSDKARIKRYYRLKESNPGGQSLTPRGSEIDPAGSEVDPRTKKETHVERNSGKVKGPAPTGAVSESPSPAQERLAGLRSHLGADPFTMAATCAAAQQKEGNIWTVPVEAGGTDTVGELMLSAWLKAKGVDPALVPKTVTDKYRLRLSKLAESLEGITPTQAARAVELVLDKRNQEFSYYTYSDPAVEKFKRDWTEVALRLLSGQPGNLTARSPGDHGGQESGPSKVRRVMQQRGLL